PPRCTLFPYTTLFRSWAANNQVKLNGAYPLRWWSITLAATFQSLPGATDVASYAAPNSLVAPSLGHNLGSCGALATCTGTALLRSEEHTSELQSPCNL